MSVQSMFQSFYEGGILLEVAADGMNVLTPSTGKRAIGTRGLNGCTCVVILGASAILLAHIKPFPGDFQQGTWRDIPKESHDHHEYALAAIVGAVKQNLDRFPASTTAWGIFARSKEAGFVRSIFRQVQSQMQVMGYDMRPAFYDEKPVPQITPPKGELVAYFNRSGGAELWLERSRLWPSTQAHSAESSSVAAAASSTSLSTALSTAALGATTAGSLSREWAGYNMSCVGDQIILDCTFNERPTKFVVKWTNTSLPMIWSTSQNQWITTAMDEDTCLYITMNGQKLKLGKS